MTCQADAIENVLIYTKRKLDAYKQKKKNRRKGESPSPDRYAFESRKKSARDPEGEDARPKLGMGNFISSDIGRDIERE